MVSILNLKKKKKKKFKKSTDSGLAIPSDFLRNNFGVGSCEILALKNISLYGTLSNTVINLKHAIYPIMFDHKLKSDFILFFRIETRLKKESCLMRQDNTIYKFSIKFSFSSIGQDRSKLQKQISKLLYF